MNRLLRDHLDKLYPFIRIAESRSLRQAAENLRLSLPSVLHTVKILEDAVGKPLIQRNRLGISPTPEGSMLLDFAKRTLERLEEAEVRLRTGQSRAAVLRIGTFETLAVRFWPPFIRSFSKSHPEIALSLLSRPQEPLLEALERGEIHAAIALEPAPTFHFSARKLFNESFGLFASREFMRSHKILNRSISRETLRKHPLVFVPDARINLIETLESSLWKHGLEGRLSYRLDSFEAVYQFAANGVGIGVLPRSLFTRTAAASVQRLALKDIPEMGVHSICWIQGMNKAESPSLRVLRHALKEAMGV